MSVSDPQTMNRYSYAQNDPVNRIDPSGLEETLTCYVDGIPVSCSFGLSLINSGAGYLNGPAGFYGGGSLLVTYAGNLSVDGLGLGFQQAFLIDPQSTERGGGQDDKEIQRRIEAGKAWDRWNAWNSCAHPIWERYQIKLNEFNKIGGEAFWMEVGVGIAAAFSVGTVNGPGMWGTFLLGLKAHKTERDKINQIHSDYQAEVTSTCGPEVPKPASPN